jgi:hypothetical protein
MVDMGKSSTATEETVPFEKMGYEYRQDDFSRDMMPSSPLLLAGLPVLRTCFTMHLGQGESRPCSDS